MIGQESTKYTDSELRDTIAAFIQISDSERIADARALQRREKV